MSNRLQVVIVGAIVLIAGAFFVWRQMGASAAPVARPVIQETAVIDQGDVQTTLNASGAIEANQNVNLSFQATGKVASISVNQGDHVLKGQLIATLDDQAALDSLLLVQAKVNSSEVALHRLTDQPRQVDINVDKTALNLANAQLDEALHSVDRLQAQIAQLGVDNAKNGLWLQQLSRDADTKQKNDLQKNPLTAPAANALPSDTVENAALTSKDFDVQVAQANLQAAQTQIGNVGSIAAARAQVLSAQNALNKLMEGGDKQDILRAQANLKSAQSSLEQARTQLGKTRLVAPFDGVIAVLNLDLGEQAPQGPAAVLLDTSKFYVDLQIDEVAVAKISTGQIVNLKFDALPGAVLPGTVSRIADTGDRTGSVVSYTVRVEIQPEGRSLLSSMTTTANIVTGSASQVTRIPNRFVYTDRSTGKTYAALSQPDGSSRPVEITLGLQDQTMSEVKTGLKVGDVVTLPQGVNKLITSAGASASSKAVGQSQ